MPYRYSREITEIARETKVIAMLTHGNHKSAQDEPESVEQLLSKDVVHGFSMDILIKLVPLSNPKRYGPTRLTGEACDADCCADGCVRMPDATAASRCISVAIRCRSDCNSL